MSLTGSPCPSPRPELDRRTPLPCHRESARINFAFYQIVAQIVDTETRLIWFEEVLINGRLCGWATRSIVDHWGTILVLTFQPFFEQKSYFAYFLHHFTDLSLEAVTLLKRAGHLNLEIIDADALFFELTEAVDSGRILTLLSIIRDLSAKLRELKYSKGSLLLNFLENENAQIATFAVESLYQLLDVQFYTRIWEILTRIRHPGRVLLKSLEERLPDSPGLFALNCAFAIIDPDVILTAFPNQLPTNPLWFVFPVLLFVLSKNEQRTRLADIIARSSSGRSSGSQYDSQSPQDMKTALE
jgi:hypothetical protein